ncbi:hypothetical protein M413DRAFT_21833 [Hebeloma cylindrosporum]|uniref:Uncharacterized protein n=1 Tax=Hebeloma cylindrosporum TaxID=76867 RepID=A0A0C3D0P7_HEBCY|nr:hypothetical protein M413DRAFT_21833 [Hebeloma cylindrosporum h7]
MGVLLLEDFNVNDLPDVDFERLDDELAINLGGVNETKGRKASALPINIPTGQKKKKDESHPTTKAESSCHPRRQLRGRIFGSITCQIFTIAGSSTYSMKHALQITLYAFPIGILRRTLDPALQFAAGRACPSRCFLQSRAFMEADRVLQASPPEPGCDLPRCVAALMLSSDATHIAQSGQAKLWPIYTYHIGNRSKYERGRPYANTGYNVAFLASLPDAITEFYSE